MEAGKLEQVVSSMAAGGRQQCRCNPFAAAPPLRYATHFKQQSNPFHRLAGLTDESRLSAWMILSWAALMSWYSSTNTNRIF
jgi:hypothetical protein